jgi:hypothetical protein
MFGKCRFFINLCIGLMMEQFTEKQAAINLRITENQ